MPRFLTTAIMALAVFAPRVLGDPFPSLAPSASPAPSYIDVAQFEWDLERYGDVEISLTEESDMSEITMHYNISIRDTAIQAFESDCTTPIPSDIAKLSFKRVITSPSHADFTVLVDIAQENVTDYPGVWTDVGVGQGLISMCIRVDLTLGGTSVTFHEQKLFISINMLQGFEISGVDVDRTDPDEIIDSIDVDYNVTAFQCDDNGDVSNEVLTQGSAVFLCVETTASNVEIASIRELQMTQGAFNTTPIVAGSPDALTQVTIVDKEATIRYQIISAFFEDSDPADIVATGSVLLAFTDDNGARRFLRRAKVLPPVPSRELQLENDEVEEEEGFNAVQMKVQSVNPPVSSGACGVVDSFASMIVLMVGGAVAMA